MKCERIASFKRQLQAYLFHVAYNYECLINGYVCK